MTTALRIGIAACAMQLVACSNILGLQDIIPDGSPYRLSFIGPPTSVAVQEPLDLLAVRVEDVVGSPAESRGIEIRLALTANPGGASLLGTLTTKVGSDTALFDLVYLDKPGTGYTLVASADGLIPATMTFDVVPAFTHVSSGADGGSVSGITSSPAPPTPPGGSSTLFATAGTLVFTSTNGGMSWAPPGIGGSGGVARVVTDPQHPGVAYALPFSGARYLFRKTTDGGMTWRAATIDGINLGQLTEQADAIAIDPANSSILYVATYVSKPPFGMKLHRSTDGGMTWTTSSSVPNARCRSLVIERATTSNLYCTTNSSLLRSTNSGANWISDNGNGIDQQFPTSIFATPGALFVYAGGQLYRSIDHAMSWTLLPIAYAGALAFAPSMPQRVYLGDSSSVRVSNDAGASFGTPVGTLPFSVLQFMVDAQNPDLVYAATDGGVFKSSNAGVSWSPASTGINVNPITAVVPVPRTPGAWLVSTPQSVVRTTNNGATWTQVAPISQAQLALDPANAANVYACGLQQFAASTDGGAHFGAATSSVACYSGGATENLVVAGNTLFASDGGTPRKSIDRGVSWADVGGINPSTQIRGLAFGDTAGSVVLVGTTDGLLRSINGGTSFQRVSADLVLGLFSDPNAPSHVYVETKPCAFHYSTDGGATFNTTLTTSIPSGCYTAYGTAGGTLYAGGAVFEDVASSLIRSTDGGANWSVISSAGLPTGIMITSIAVADDGTIFLGTTGGLYRSGGH